MKDMPVQAGRIRITVLVLAAAGLFAWTGAGIAQPGEENLPTRLLTLEYENDVFARSDGGYTSGVRATWGDRNWQLPRWLEHTAQAFPLFPETDEPILWGASLGQTIFTPENITEPEFPPEDRPYAGWLGLGAHLVQVQDDRMDRLTVMLGVVGPASGARRTQTLIHELVGSDRPVGWETQLPNEPTLLLAYDTARRVAHGGPTENGLEWEFTPTAGGAIGNAVTQVGGGFYHRIGKNIPWDFGPPRLGPYPTGSGLFLPTHEYGWYAYWGVDLSYVAHNIFLDGSLFRETAKVEKRNALGTFFMGAALQWGQNRLSYTHIIRSREYETQDDIEPYGAFSYSRLF